MTGLKVALANFIINRKMKNGKGYAKPEIAEVYLVRSNGEKIKIPKDHIMTPMHLTIDYPRKELSHIVAKEYIKGVQYRKCIPITDDFTPIFPFKYVSSFENTLKEVSLNGKNITKSFTRFLGPEMGGIYSNYAKITDVFYRDKFIKKKIKIGDELVFTFMNELSYTMQNFSYKVIIDADINDIINNFTSQ
jgi:hypothetical protein